MTLFGYKLSEIRKFIFCLGIMAFTYGSIFVMYLADKYPDGLGWGPIVAMIGTALNAAGVFLIPNTMRELLPGEME